MSNNPSRIAQSTSTDEILVKQGGVSKKANLNQLVIEGPDDTAEGVWSKPFRNPLKYQTLFDDFNLGPEIAANSKKGWTLTGVNAVVTNVGLAQLGLGMIPSSLELLTGSSSGDQCILHPATRFGAGFVSWNSRFGHLDNEFFIGTRVAVTQGLNRVDDVSIYIGATVATGMNITNPNAPAFIREGNGNFRFRWGTSGGYVADVDMEIDFVWGETMTELFAHYNNGILRLWTNRILIAELTVIDTFMSTSDATATIGIQTDTAQIVGMEVDYFMLAVDRNKQMTIPHIFP